jgi:hypothetical protein
VPELTELFGRLDRARGRSRAASGARSSSDRQRLTRPSSGCALGRARPRAGGAALERARDGCGWRRRSRSSGSGRRSRTAPPSSLRCHLCKHSGEGTRSFGRTPATSSRSPSDVSTGAHVDVSLAEGGFGARVEEVTP